MRKLISNLLIAGLFLFGLFTPKPALAAYEDPVPEGQLIKSYIDVAYFQVWKHSNGTWQDTDHDGTRDMPGQTKTWSYKVTGVLNNYTNQWDLTGVRVRYLNVNEWNEAIYQQNNGYAGMSYEDFDKNILYFASAQGYEGKVWAETNLSDLSYTLHYDGIRLALDPGISDMETAKKGAMNLKIDQNIQFLKTLGIPLSVPPGGFLKMAEGWNYWVPYIVEIYGKPKLPAPDLYVKTLDPGTSEVVNGNAYTGTVVFGLAKDYHKPVQAKLTLTNNGWSIPGVDGQVVEFKPGEEKSFTFVYHGDSGGCNLLAKINPIDPPDDKDWSNNKKEIYVPPVQIKPGKGELTFQAYSQGGPDIYGNYIPPMPREPNTAKWTDTVKATLRPPAPVPPRGTLDWWKITSAKLTYPKKHPEFTFGHPLEPVGTVTIDMTPNGHEATAEFREDWSLNGAPIYDILEDRMIPGPTEYTITADYTIEYQYHYTECDEDGCWTVTETATKSGSASGQLLVNGTGVNSL
jgi:hypothetical protein